MTKFVLLFAYLTLFASFGFAKQEPRSVATDNHLKVMNYSPQTVHSYTGFYGYQSSIVFDVDEIVDTISMGDSIGWQIIPQGNRLFIKPVADKADTNATIITNKRTYYFEFHADEATGLDDPRLAYEVRFIYPSTDSLTSVGGDVMFPLNHTEIPNLKDVETAKSGLNFKYSVAHSSGAENVVPLQVFDDGRFTYIKFADVNADVPSIFNVDSEGFESLINFRTVDQYIVVERVASAFTLRHGSDTVCLFNENRLFGIVNKHNSSSLKHRVY